MEEYINLLIKAEESKGGENLSEWLEELNKLKDIAQLEKSVLQEGQFNPFKGYNMTHEVKPVKDKASETESVGCFFGIINWFSKK